MFRENKPIVLTIYCILDSALIKTMFLYVLQKTRTMMHICPTLKWSRNSGAKRLEKRNVLPWRFFLMFWKNIMGINSSSQTGIWFLLEVSSALQPWNSMNISHSVRVYVCSAVWKYPSDISVPKFWKKKCFFPLLFHFQDVSYLVS